MDIGPVKLYALLSIGYIYCICVRTAAAHGILDDIDSSACTAMGLFICIIYVSHCVQLLDFVN